MNGFMEVFIGVLTANATFAILLFIFNEAVKKLLDRDFFVFQHRFQHDAATKNLRYAFLGEIYAIVRVIELRKLLEIVDGCINHCKEGNPQVPDFSVSGNYFNVYFKNIDKIGILDAKLAKSVSAFYTIASSVVEDLNWMASPDAKGISSEKALTEMLPMRDALAEMIKLGKDIVRYIEEPGYLDQEIKFN